MKYQFIFTEEQLQILNLALQELPFKVVAALFDSINAQIKEQQPKD